MKDEEHVDLEQTQSGGAILLSPSENFQLAQAMYHIITGKTEKLTHSYNGNYKINFASITQLNTKLQQMIQQWNILGQTCNITVSHMDDNTQKFSSYERFQLYDQTLTSPIKSIVFNFNFLIKLPDTRCEEKYRTQHYNISIRLSSRTVAYNEKPIGMPTAVLKLFSDSVVVSEIEYVDYNIARSVNATIDSWVNNLEKTEENRILEILQAKSNWIVRFISLGIFSITIVALWNNITTFSTNYDYSLLIQYGLLCSGTIFISLRLGEYLGRACENGIDSIAQISYIEINTGDKRSISKFKRNNRLNIVKVILSFMFATLQAMFIEKIATVVIEFIKKI